MRSLPAHVMVRYTIAQSLYSGESSDVLIRRLSGSLRQMDSWDQAWKMPSTSANRAFPHSVCLVRRATEGGRAFSP